MIPAKAMAFVRFGHFGDHALAHVAGWPALPGITGIMVDRVMPPPANLPYRSPTDPSVGDARAPYDAVLSLTGDSDALRAVDWPGLLGNSGATVHAYAVEPRLRFDRTPANASAHDGWTLVGRLMFHADMPDSAARRSWGLHAPLAERVHVGACRYVQNWVVERLSADAPPARGIPQLHFPDEAALIDRFFDSARGREEILQDTAHFVESGPRLYVRRIVGAICG